MTSAARDVPSDDASRLATTRDACDPADADEVTCVSIGGQPCRVVCVDDILPRHLPATRHNTRTQFAYAAREVVHFEFGGHRYALVREAPEAPPADAREPADDTIDIRRILTNRELQIVQLICMGCLAKQAADQLHISEFTVRSYLKTIYNKLGVKSRGAMVYRYAQTFNRPSARS